MNAPKGFLDAINQASIPQFKYFDSIGSTNQEALSWLESGAPDGAIVFADHQSSGRGRFERNWVTQPSSAIAVSIVVKPTEIEKQSLSLFSPLAAIALVDVLKTYLDIDAQIKWPNDVLIERMKTSGILTEALWNGDKLFGLVVGIGINVLPGSIPPSNLLQFPATCLQNHRTHPIDRFFILSRLLAAFSFWRSRMQSPEFMNQWQKTLAFRDEKVYIKQKDGSIQVSGILSGLTINGDLEILTENNHIQIISVGDVHLRPAESENER